MIPASKKPIVLRTEFSDESAWHSVKDAIGATSVTFLDDAKYADETEEATSEMLASQGHSFAFVVDGKTIKSAEHPVLVIDLSEDQEPSFRALPETIDAMANALSTNSFEFADFAEQADRTDDGIFRGFDDDDEN